MRGAAALTLLLAAVAGQAAPPAKPSEASIVVSALDLLAGDKVAVFGAAGGELLDDLVAAVGPTGKIYFLESDATLVEALTQRIDKAGVQNATALVMTADEPRLPELADAILVFHLYRHLEDSRQFLRRIKPLLAPEGRLSIFDYYRRRTPKGPPVAERVASHRVLRDVQHEGFYLVKKLKKFDDRYFLLFRLK